MVVFYVIIFIKINKLKRKSYFDKETSIRRNKFTSIQGKIANDTLSIIKYYIT